MKVVTLFIALCCAVVSAMAGNSINITFTHDGLQLHGRLEIPSSGNGPFPVIILAPGSGANDKDCTVAMIGANVSCLYPDLFGDTLRPYKALSQALSDSGYAVFTYDKVEYSYPNPGTITFHKLWMPVESAIAYLKTRTEVDAQQIILLGHSEGSGIIPYITQSHPEVKALISLAGPRTPFDSILAYQIKNIMATCNGDTNLGNTQAGQILQYYGAIRSGNWNGVTPPIFGVSAAVWSEYIKVFDSVSYRYNAVNKPTLFIGLGNDINVPVATELHRFKQENTTGADFYELLGLNHYLCTNNNPVTAREVPDTIVYWLRKQGIVTGLSAVQESGKGIQIKQEGSRIYVMSGKAAIKKIVVVDMNGRVVLEQNGNSVKEQIDISGRASGIYVLKVLAGKDSASFKVALH